MEQYDIMAVDTFEELKKEISRLRDEVSALILEKEELTNVICPRILSEYYDRFGRLEYAVSAAELKYQRLKRLMEITQAILNRGEKINLRTVMEQLSRELGEIERKLREFAETIENFFEKTEAAKEQSAKRTPEEKEKANKQSADEKKLYRDIVKRLHPDMNPKRSEAEERLFQQAVEAYEKHDLETLEIIHAQLDDIGKSGDGADPVANPAANAALSPDERKAWEERLLHQKDLLEKERMRLRAEIDQIKQKKPYILKVYLEDEEKAEKRQEELEKLLKSYQAGIEEYDRLLDESGVPEWLRKTSEEAQ